MKYTNHVTSDRVRQDSGSSAGSGGGRLTNLLHRPKPGHRGSDSTQQSPVSLPASPHVQQQTESTVPSNSKGALLEGHHRKAPNEFDENPPIPSSPGSTPPKKSWEGAYSKFLRGKSNKSNNKSTSPTLSSSFDSTASLPNEVAMSNNKAENTGEKKSTFSLIPGTRRLVSRTPLTPGRIHGLVQVDESKVPPFPSLRVSPRSTAAARKQDMAALDEHLHGGLAKKVTGSPGKEGSVRGGKFFNSIFASSSNSNIPHSSSSCAIDPLDQRHRRYQSMDALDMPLRKGVGKSSSASLSPVNLSTKNSTPAHASLAVDKSTSREELHDPESDNLDLLLASAATTPSGQNFVVSFPRFPQRASSTGGMPNSGTADSIGLSPAMLSRPVSGYLYPRSYSNEYHHEAQSATAIAPLVPPLPSGLKWSTSDASHNVGLTLDDSDRSESDDRLRNAPDYGSQSDMLSYPNVTVSTSGYCPSSPSHLLQTNDDMKKIFTTFHNAPKYARDASSAFLGGDNSSSLNLAAAHDAFVSYHSSLLRSGGHMAISGDIMSERHIMYSSRPLETVEEQDISIHTGMRLLKPVQGTETWQSGRRYLIAPAVMSACPLPAIKKLSGSLIQSASEAATSGRSQAFGTVDLGEALMTYVGDKHHLSLGKWSSCRLVLRQNYLLEFETSTPINGLPRGHMHLQYAVAYAHADFQDVLELQFYGSPCAKSDHRTLRIQVQNREERGHWISCLNTAANLRMEDIWDIARDRPIGTGRYASVFPATRRSADDDLSSQPSMCALKVVDKNEFWRRVVKGRERSDTLVREVAVQATLSAKGSSITSSFVHLCGFFETSDHAVIELEILDGVDLFEHIQSKGSLSADESKIIIRDVLSTLEGMNRNGLAHRDVKPANILIADTSKHGVSVKLCDFGMSTFVGMDGLVRGRCGTPGYVAPEILTAGTRAGYGNKVDVFSAGVTLYLMLSGVEPFYGESEQELVEDNTNAKVTFPKKYWGSISSDAKDLVQRMLQADPKDRLSAKEALGHPWLANVKNNPAMFSSVNLPEEGVCSVM
ncbi:Ser/Thr protein kinase [Nitzschia inconspicua]|uniref:Ser/Thr protein kinase n=1 Tax=Nitzschia inconspicua TaxID=303405 RepID=A0A9K3KQW0_9STRA|nr:Ser/Thr protein kinase [Nitzschia inconspicua]